MKRLLYLTNLDEQATNYPHIEKGVDFLEHVVLNFIMEGLRKHGQTHVLNTILDRRIGMAQKGCIWEMHNPETAVGHGAKGLGMNMLIVDWMKRLDRI